MLDFILQYWVEFVFGIIAAGLVAAGKYFSSLVKKQIRESLRAQMTVLTNTLQRQMTSTDEAIKADIAAIKTDIQGLHDKLDAVEQKEADVEAKIGALDAGLTTLKNGTLSLQGKQFKDECRGVLNQKEPIQLTQFETLEAEHNVYKSLGGNHDGDELWDLIKIKYHNTLK